MNHFGDINSKLTVAVASGESLALMPEEVQALLKELAHLTEENKRLTGQFEQLVANHQISIGNYEKLLKLFNTIPDSIYIKDTECRIILINQSAPLHQGYLKPSDIIGHDDFELFPYDLAKKYYTDDQYVLRTGESLIGIEEEVVDASGNKRWFSTTKMPLKADNGKIIGIIGLGRDITKRKKAEDEVILREKEYKLMADNSTDIIMRISLDGTFLYVSPASKQLGYEPNLLIGKKVFDYLYEPDRFKLVGFFSEAKKVQTSVIAEYRMITTSGFYVWMEASMRLVKALDTGEAHELIMVLRNISERKRTDAVVKAYSEKLKYQNEDLLKVNQELNLAKQKAEESDRLKSTFLANMSHEIRTPINAIIGFSQLLDDDELDHERKAEFLGLIKFSSNQLVALIDDIIDISKLEVGQLKILKRPCDLHRLFDGLLAIFEKEKELKEKGNLLLFVEKGIEKSKSHILTDPIRLNQIMVNLIGNALKFTNTGSITFGFKLGEENTLLFYCKDTGQGVAVDQQHAVFERFRQVEGGLTRQYGGAGLGLSICKGLVELMGGHIYLESVPNLGSMFYFTLPHVVAEPSNEGGTLVHSKKKTYDWSNRKFLVVEDMDMGYLFLKESLQKTGAYIVRAKDGVEAVSLFQSEPGIDLVLMDIQLPKKNGLEATREIKLLNSKIPIIAQTAYAQAEDRQKALEAGCDSYIAKPIDQLKLFELIKSMLT